jgi:hypothetical protein
MVFECGRGGFMRFWQCHPGLDAVQRAAGLAQVFRRAFGMRDAAPGGHPVYVAWMYRLHRAERIAMQYRAFEQIGDRRQTDMRMRPHGNALFRREGRRPHVVEENERADHLVRMAGQQAFDGKSAKILHMRFQQRKGRGSGGHRQALQWIVNKTTQNNEWRYRSVSPFVSARFNGSDYAGCANFPLW